MNQYHYQGRAYLRVNGKRLPTKQGASLNPGGVQRPALVGSEVYGYTETPEAASLSCTIPNGPGVSLMSIRAMTDVTIEFECDTGPTFLLANAWASSIPTLTAEGDIAVTFTAVDCKEV